MILTLFITVAKGGPLILLISEIKLRHWMWGHVKFNLFANYSLLKSNFYLYSSSRL